PAVQDARPECSAVAAAGDREERRRRQVGFRGKSERGPFAVERGEKVSLELDDVRGVAREVPDPAFVSNRPGVDLKIERYGLASCRSLRTQRDGGDEEDHDDPQDKQPAASAAGHCMAFGESSSTPETRTGGCLAHSRPSLAIRSP